MGNVGICRGKYTAMVVTQVLWWLKAKLNNLFDWYACMFKYVFWKPCGSLF